MKKIIALTFITFDGVMQAPGGPQEDPEITPGASSSPATLVREK